MSKSMNMLRTRRRDNNVKPNRRLDRKSSRGMIYENEELRLKTININAEIERGQSDIKKLRRENELLKKEIWSLRDEYEKLDKLLKDKDVDFSSSTCTSDSDSCSSCTDDAGAVESSQNFENVQKTNMKNLHVEFDHLSVVPEENSEENSLPNEDADVIKPDQSYPPFTKTPVHFFSPITPRDPSPQSIHEVFPLQKTSSDIIVKLDNQQLNGCNGSFSNGGNLEELLNDIETISNDILEISQDKEARVPYKSELNVVLMPTPMPLIGFEKYENLKTGSPLRDNFFLPELLPPLPFISQPPDPPLENRTLEPPQPNNIEEVCGSRCNLLDLTSSEHVSSENEENLRFNATQVEEPKPKPEKMSIRRKVSIHFKGKKEKKKEDSLEVKPHLTFRRDSKMVKTPSLDSKKFEDALKKQNSAEPKSSGSERNSQAEKKAGSRKSSSTSPDRKHIHAKEQDAKKHKKHKKVDKFRQRRSTVSAEHGGRERSFSVCTDRSLFSGGFGSHHGEERHSSERERTNSLSSCGSMRMRKMSNMSNIPLSGKIPWCACWGNGCL